MIGMLAEDEEGNLYSDFVKIFSSLTPPANTNKGMPWLMLLLDKK